jgi:hypothetical protein
VFSAVVSAVSVTQIWRAGLATGFVVWGRRRLGLYWSACQRVEELAHCAYVNPPVASSVWWRMMFANACASLPVSTS